MCFVLQELLQAQFLYIRTFMFALQLDFGDVFLLPSEHCFLGLVCRPRARNVVGEVTLARVHREWKTIAEVCKLPSSLMHRRLQTTFVEPALKGSEMRCLMGLGTLFRTESDFW